METETAPARAYRIIPSPAAAAKTPWRIRHSPANPLNPGTKPIDRANSESRIPSPGRRRTRPVSRRTSNGPRSRETKAAARSSPAALRPWFIAWRIPPLTADTVGVSAATTMIQV